MRRALGVWLLVLAAAPAVAGQLPPAGASADIQMSLCSAWPAIEKALDLSPVGAPFEVWLFDDPALSLFRKGLRIRLREKGKVGDLTLKVADQDCADAARLPGAEGKCEYDLHDGRLSGSLSLTRKVDEATTTALVAGKALAEQLSPTQRRFLLGGAGLWPLPPDMRALGPMQVSSYRTRDKRYVVDVSVLPGGERYVEISRKVAVADVARLHEQLQSDLAKAGVAACDDQSAQAGNKLRALLR